MDLARLRQLLELDPDDPLANYAVGSKLVNESDDPKDHAEAIPLLRKAVDGDRHHLAAYYALAKALQSTGNDAAAKTVVEEALAALPTVPPGSGADLEDDFRELLNDLS